MSIHSFSAAYERQDAAAWERVQAAIEALNLSLHDFSETLGLWPEGITPSQVDLVYRAKVLDAVHRADVAHQERQRRASAKHRIGHPVMLHFACHDKP